LLVLNFADVRDYIFSAKEILKITRNLLLSRQVTMSLLAGALDLNGVQRCPQNVLLLARWYVITQIPLK
jgi:hypothetical protein